MKLMKIKSIKKINHDSKRYDLEVEDNHNFFANNILVHNCTTMYKYVYFARSLNHRDHPSHHWLKNFKATVSHLFPPEHRFCGENVYAKHSIAYKNLPSYFLLFSIFNNERCLSWHDTLIMAKDIGFSTVPVLYEGKFDLDKVKACYTGKSVYGDEQEGYVVRVADEIYGFETINKCTCAKHLAKFVRENHVQTDEHWKYQEVVPNLLKGQNDE